MSKYYKAEDVERLVENICNVMIGKEEPIETSLSDLPTIEVSEDAISREWLIKRFKDIVEHYKMRIKRTKRYGKKTSYDTSEQIGYWKDEIADYNYFIREIENTPSVVPKPKEGEWVETPEGTMCSNCHKFPYDDGEYHIANWHSDYCPFCGAKMKGAEE